jgi:hypothetical protein
MRTVRDFARLSLFCAAGALFTASLAGAQMGVPDVPTGTGPSCAMPAPIEPPTSGLPGVVTPWGALALRPLIPPAWPFLAAVSPTSWFHPAVMRESRGWSLSVSRAAAGRHIKR